MEEDVFLAELEGTYVELFPVICAEEREPLWDALCETYVGSEMAQTLQQVLQTTCVGELYGQEAVDAYTADPSSTVFNCFFLGGVTRFVFEGNTITGLDGEGNQVFSHAYDPVGDRACADVPVVFHLYQSRDKESGMFTYMAFTDDTPSNTYHIEFRYGEDAEELLSYYAGSCAYWLAAGILEDADEDMISDCITLFVSENATALNETAGE